MYLNKFLNKFKNLILNFLSQDHIVVHGVLCLAFGEIDC